MIIHHGYYFILLFLSEGGEPPAKQARLEAPVTVLGQQQVTPGTLFINQASLNPENKQVLFSSALTFH